MFQGSVQIVLQKCITKRFSLTKQNLLRCLGTQAGAVGSGGGGGGVGPDRVLPAEKGRLFVLKSRRESYVFEILQYPNNNLQNCVYTIILCDLYHHCEVNK